jgi:hypothetical protein
MLGAVLAAVAEPECLGERRQAARGEGGDPSGHRFAKEVCV